MKLSVTATVIFFLLFQLCYSGRSGGRGGSSSSSSKSSLPRNPSSYPKQTYQPAPSGSRIGGGGFVNPSGSNLGRNYGSDTQRYVSGKKGSSIFGGSSPGHLASQQGGLQRQKGLFGSLSGSKGFAVGVGAGFIGGALAGAAAISMYHNYLAYKRIVHCFSNPGFCTSTRDGLLFDDGRRCIGVCSTNAYCDYGICRCRAGYETRYGFCWDSSDSFYLRINDWNRRLSPSFNPFHSCFSHYDCSSTDMNMICSNGQCACRQEMQWNRDALECQIFVDVDCSQFEESNSTASYQSLLDEEVQSNETTSDKEPILAMAVSDNNATGSESPLSTSIANSDLMNIDLNRTSSPVEIQAAFCRQVKKIEDKFELFVIEEHSAGNRANNCHSTVISIVNTMAVMLFVFIECVISLSI